MSSRNVRRLREREEAEKRGQGNNDDVDPEEFQPHFVCENSNMAFQGLQVEIPSDDSSISEMSPREPFQDEAAALPEEDKYAKKKNTKKNKKKLKKTTKYSDDLEKAIDELNREFGSPGPALAPEVLTPELLRIQQHKKIFKINPNRINVNYELSREKGDKTYNWRPPGLRRTRHEIGLSADVIPFHVKGISMTRYKTEGNLKFFKLEHNADYEARCRAFTHEVWDQLRLNGPHEVRLHPENCVEALLENCDFLYLVEEHASANKALEQAIFCMQNVGATSFNFVDGLCRLPYTLAENRPFHLAILKYLHVLTNIAFHRTALELAKVLLNLDPSDPLAVILIIDTLALRAREYQWLLDLVEYWKEERQPERLYHMRYSIALALFQLACKKKNHNAVEEAKRALMTAVMEFPPLAVRLMEFTRMPVPPEIKNHPIFDPPKNVAVSLVVNELMTMYAWLNMPRWREAHIVRWFIDTMIDLCDKYDHDPAVEVELVELARVRGALYLKYPTQIKRHLYVLSSMGKYVFDNPSLEQFLPRAKPTIACNPYPPEGEMVDTYQYYEDWMAEPQDTLLALIRNIYPHLYQLGRKNMEAVLKLMDGEAFKSEEGHCYIVAGPRVYGPSTNGVNHYEIARLDGRGRSIEQLKMLYISQARNRIAVERERQERAAAELEAARAAALANPEVQAEQEENQQNEPAGPQLENRRPRRSHPTREQRRQTQREYGAARRWSNLMNNINRRR